VNATTTIIKFEKFHKAPPFWGNQGSGRVKAAAAGRFRRKVGYFWSLAKFMSSKVQFRLRTYLVSRNLTYIYHVRSSAGSDVTRVLMSVGTYITHNLKTVLINLALIFVYAVIVDVIGVIT
jgi:hypothetical protein